MDLSKYEVSVDAGREGVYWYHSNGPNGIIKKVIIMQKMQEENLYNLALGDEIKGHVTYSNITDNKDTKKVLATITDIIQHYTEEFPERWLYVTGDTKIKTRLYQMHIANNLEAILAEGFIVLGLNEGEEPEEFKRSKSYVGFLAKRLL